MSKTNIYGLRIITDTTHATNESIGLYAVLNGNSELRYSEAPLVGVAEAWATGFLTPDGIGELAEGGDFRRGGGLIQYKPTTITLRNTEKLFDSLRAYDPEINLSGSLCEIIEFVGTDADSDSTERRVMYSGTVEDLQWTETRLDISIVPSRDRVRRAPVGADGVPVTFGTSTPADSVFFKTQKALTVNDILGQQEIKVVGSAGTIKPGEMDLFPVVGWFNTTVNNIEVSEGGYVRLGFMDAVSLTDARISDLVGKYMLCVEGPSEATGKYRKITEASRYQTGDEVQIRLVFSDYWPVILPGIYEGTAEDQTWVQFYDIAQQYNVDSWQCDGFYDADNVKLTNAADIYSKNGDNMDLLPAYGVDIDTSNPLNNNLIIDPKLFNNGIDNLAGYRILPVENFGLYDEADLSAWNTIDEPWWGNQNKVEAGVYSTNTFSILGDGLTNPERVTDRISTTYAQHSIGVFIVPNPYYKVFAFKLPKVRNFPFTSAYLGISLWSTVSYAHSLDTFIISRGYINRAKKILSGKVLNEFDADGGFMSSIPDFYYEDNTETKNKDFYRSQAPNLQNKYPKISWYESFPITKNGVKDYNSIEECVIVLKRDIGLEPAVSDVTRIYQLAVIFENSASISEVYL